MSGGSGCTSGGSGLRSGDASRGSGRVGESVKLYLLLVFFRLKSVIWPQLTR